MAESQKTDNTPLGVSQDDEKEPKLYEIGFHIIPTVGDEGIAPEVNKIREAIEAHNGAIESEHTPEFRELAYPISKVFSNKRSEFTTSYFGWMTFMIRPHDAEALKETVDTLENVVRFLIVKTTEESAPDKNQKKTAFTASSPTPYNKRKKKDEADEGTLSESELNKTLDEIVAEES